MTPFTYAPATLGLKIVFITTAVIAFFALSGLGLYRLRASMASRRPIDVEAAVAQTQTQSVPRLVLQDTPSHLTGVDINTGSEAMLPDSMSSPKIVQHPESGLIASSSFEGWASSLCDLIEEFASGERALVASSSFEVWATNLCELISDFASPAPFRSGFTPLIDNFEDDPYIFDTSYDNLNMYEPAAKNVPEIIVTAPSLPQIAEYAYHESYEPALVSSPSFMDLAAECVEELDTNDADTTFVIEDDVETEDDIPVALADELLDDSTQYTQDEPASLLCFRYGSVLSTNLQENAPKLRSEQTSDYTPQHSHSQYLSPSSALSLPLVVEEPIVECEPEETLKSVFESDSEDDDTYYSRRPHLSRPKQPSPSMSSMLRAIVEKRKAQQSRRKESKNDKENEDYKKHSRTITSKRRFFSKALATPSEPSNPIKVPTVRFTPPTPPRGFTNRENEDLEMDEVVERVAFDLVFDDHGRCFF